MKTMNVFEKAKVRAEMFEDVMHDIEYHIHDLAYDYVKIGEEQAKNWRGELMWEDEEKTIPEMCDVFDYVRKENISEETEHKVSVLMDLVKIVEDAF